MKILSQNISYLIIAMLVFTSCSEDNSIDELDNQAPNVTINEHTAEQSFDVGGEIHLDVNLEDDQELASYKIDVHNNFDGHTHSISMAQDPTTPWSWSETHELDPGQTTFNIHQHLEVPNNAAEGAYHLGIIALDQAGNQQEAYVEVIVGEDHSGEDHGITITEINTEDAHKGGELHLGASIAAEHGIENVSLDIHGHDLTPEADEEDWTMEETFTSYSGTSAEFEEHIDVPANATAGEYHVTITVIDMEGHSHAEGAHLHVTDGENHEDVIEISGLSIPESVNVGSDMHVEASINADNGVENVHVHIHSENGNGWNYEEEYEQGGQENVNFHKHIVVPAGASTGEYHFEIEVEDTQGHTHSASEHFSIN